MVENTWAEDMGHLFCYLGLDTGKITRRLEKIKLKIIISVPSTLTKLACVVYRFGDLYNNSTNTNEKLLYKNVSLILFSKRANSLLLAER